MTRRTWFLAGIAFLFCTFAVAEEADLILHHGKIVTVDKDFSIQQAIAIQDGKILRVGSSDDVLKTKGARTEVVDLGGKTVLPGLIDSHTHASGAAMTEFDHPIPDMETIGDVLNYFKSRAAAVKEGEWIALHQVFITRLKEQRYPTREELDRVCPKNPAVFATGPDASLNSLALKLNGIDRNFKIPEGRPGLIEKDPKTGEPTGILRSYANYVKTKSSRGSQPTEKDELVRMVELFKDYNSVGITGICERSASDGMIRRYQKLKQDGNLTVRVALSYYFNTIAPLEEITDGIRNVAKHPLFMSDPMLRIIGIKVFLDGGMLTGSAYMLKPWGVSKIYAISDPNYRGTLFIPQDRLVPMVRAAVESNLQFTAHTVGDGAVQNLVDAYDEVNRSVPVRDSHPCICHSNFMTRDTVERAAKLGVTMDIQPAWLYLDARTLVNHFGYDRLRYFQPLQSIFKAGGIAGGGSDHMQKIGSLRSINPYDPWLGIWTELTRKAKWYDGQLHPEEALTREQVIRFYTINNAYILRQEKEVGSLEDGKLADLIVLDRDILTCPEDAIRDTKVVKTYLNGRLVLERK
jgi:hypothetical protein